MTLTQIWSAHRIDLRLVAARPGSSVYVPLALKDVTGFELSDEDRAADDWFLAEVVPHDCDALAHERCEQHGRVDHFDARI